MKTNIRKNYQLTVYACYIAYIVQGIVNNVNPILFTIYSKRLGITLDRIGWLIAANFGIQIMIDLAAAKECKAGGTALFAILALAGDLGCITGPEVVSLIATATPRYGLRAGLFVAIVFPVLMLIGVLRIKEKGR